MKKFGILLLSLCATTPAFADFATNCTNAGGTIITANSYGNDKGGLCNDPSNPDLTKNCNGKSFCLGHAMNWWSAFTWCESIGGKFASFSSMCPGTAPAENGDSNACPNLKGLSSFNCVESSLGFTSERMFSVCAAGNLQTGWNRTGVHGSFRILCEE